ncbi:hypothetical protein ACFLT4_03600 [Chloroflexota bacterium]
MKKLVCDRCDLEITDKYDVDLALEGQYAWEVAIRTQGHEPRGVYPCKNYLRCGGEMQVVKDRKGILRRR